MLTHPMNNRSRSFLPALGPMLATVLAVVVVLCCALPGAAQNRENGKKTPSIDWSRDTVALLPDGSPATQAREYAVQVAMVRDIGWARELAADIASRGHTPYILTMADESGALWHTVRLDIYQDVGGALDAARKFLEAEGVPPSIVQPGSLKGLPVNEARFFVQVAAFESEENALRHAADLRSQGMEAGVVRRVDRDDGAVWNVVHIGVFNTFSDAAARAEQYTEETNCACFVVLVQRDLLEERTLPLPETEPDAGSSAGTNNTATNAATDAANTTQPAPAASPDAPAAHNASASPPQQ